MKAFLSSPWSFLRVNSFPKLIRWQINRATSKYAPAAASSVDWRQSIGPACRVAQGWRSQLAGCGSEWRIDDLDLLLMRYVQCYPFVWIHSFIRTYLLNMWANERVRKNKRIWNRLRDEVTASVRQSRRATYCLLSMAVIVRKKAQSSKREHKMDP